METILLNILWVIGGLGLIIYPGILLANIMSLAAWRDKTITYRDAKFWFRVLPFRGFLIVTTLYPVIYFLCLRFSKMAFADEHFAAAVMWALPGFFFSGGLYWFLLKR